MIDSHQQEDIVEALEQQPLEVRAQVEEMRVDRWGGFPKVVEKVFPNAVIVIHGFHHMKAVNEELKKIRRQTGVLDRDSKFILWKNGADLTTEEKVKLEQLLQRS